MADKKKTTDDIHAAAQALGRRGGLKGGDARAAALSPARRKAIAIQGAEARRDGRASGAGNMSKMSKKKSGN